MKQMTVREAARELGVSRSRVYAFIRSGRLEAQRHGRDYAILPTNLDAVRVRKTGYPGRAYAVAK